MDKDGEIRAGEGVRVETDFTLQGCRGRICLWQGDSVGLIGLVLAPRWRTEQVSVRMIPRGEFNPDTTTQRGRAIPPKHPPDFEFKLKSAGE